MIVIDTDLSYIQNRLSINPVKFQTEYADASVNEIIQAEAAQGNQAAIALANEILNNVDLVIELFALADPANKFRILKEMTSEQMQKFLPQMEKEDLLLGLYFFTEDGLMAMLEKVPPEQLVNVAFQLFSKEDIIQLMPEKQLDKFLESAEIDKSMMLKHLMSIPPEYLAQMLENVTGEAVKDLDSYDMIKQIGKMNPLQYKDALQGMQPTQKQQLVLSLGKENPELFQLFDANAYTNMIKNQKEKPDMIKAMIVLEQEELIKMIKELPNDLLAIVITQIDTKVFAENMMKEFPEVLAKIMAV